MKPITAGSRLLSLCKWLLYILAAVVFCLAENTWYTLGTRGTPFLLPMLAAACGVSEGARRGAFFGIFCGVLSDAAGGSTVWVLPVLYALIGYFAGRYGNGLFRRRFSVCWLCMCAGAFLCALFRLLAGWTVSRFSDPLAGVPEAGWGFLLSAVIGWLLCLPLMLISVIGEDTTRRVKKRTRISGNRTYRR